MKFTSRAKIGILFVGDVAALYVSLFLVLAFRYGTQAFSSALSAHLVPFSAAFVLWLLVFYIAGLYDLRRLRNNIDFVKTLLLTLFVNALLTVLVFYVVPNLGIAPKTNLFAFILVFVICELWWRRFFNLRATFREGLNRVLMFASGPLAEETIRFIKTVPQMGYEITAWFEKGKKHPNAQTLDALVGRYQVNLIVIPYHMRHEEEMSKMFYALLSSGVAVMDFPTFYESVFRKIPLSEINEAWFLEHQLGGRRFFDDLKRGIELFAAALLSITLLPLLLLVAILVRMTSQGPAIYTQVRAGRGGRSFTLYKFRTMVKNSETNGAQWAERNDTRITPVGRLLRHTHIDELPQLWNILRGELSFVGPRPERPEFVTLLEVRIPYYRVRHLVKPGVTGWAQVNFRYGASEEDAEEKLTYDLYYLKNRSLILDIAIVLKTIKSFFVNHT